MSPVLVIERCTATQYYEGTGGRKSIKFVMKSGEIVVSTESQRFDNLPEEFVKVTMEVRGRVFQGEKGPVTQLTVDKLDWELAGAAPAGKGK